MLGDSVNLASRLEGLTKFYGVKILIGEQTAQNLDGFLIRHVDRVRVKGKDRAVDCFEPLCDLTQADPRQVAEVKAWHVALDWFHRQHWDQAESALRKLLKASPHTHLYQVYLDRIAGLRAVDLPRDWDGSYTHTSK